MSNQFIFFCVNVGNESLLKKEIACFYPELSLSYSRKGFLTFKNKGIEYTVDTIAQLQVTFATRVGICLGKAKPDNLIHSIQEQNDFNIDNFIIHSFSINTDFILGTSLLLSSLFSSGEGEGEGEVNAYSSHGKYVLNLMALGENEVWYGVHYVAKGITRYPNSTVEIVLPDHTVSNGFLKLAQVFKLFSLKTSVRDAWLDFGCSPGGSSSFLISNGARVWGIDTAKVNPLLKTNSKFHMIQSSVQNLSQEDLPDIDIRWVHVDLNLSPNQAIKEVLRLCKKYNNSLKGIVFTIQLVRDDFIQYIEEFEDIFYDWGFHEMMSRQVPAHKNEYVLIARR